MANKNKKEFIKEYVTASGAYPTPARILASALRAIGKKEEAYQIYWEWPGLRKAMLKYVEYVSDLFPGKKGEPLINHALLNAINGFEENRGSDIYVRVRAFIQALVMSAPQLLKYTVSAEDEDGRWMCWEPFSEPVMKWAKRQIHPTIRVQAAHWTNYNNHDIARMKLLGAIFRFHDLEVIGFDVRTCLDNQEPVSA